MAEPEALGPSHTRHRAVLFLLRYERETYSEPERAEAFVAIQRVQPFHICRKPPAHIMMFEYHTHRFRLVVSHVQGHKGAANR